jgi:hypothetical protein
LALDCWQVVLKLQLMADESTDKNVMEEDEDAAGRAQARTKEFSIMDRSLESDKCSHNTAPTSLIMTSEAPGGGNSRS